MKNAAQLRAALIGKVHALANRMGYDDATYRTVLLTQTGKTSCREMSDRQLSRLAEALECLSKGKPLPDAGKAPQASANGLGWQMLPTAKVVDLGELSRAAMSKVISGLTRRLAQLKAVAKVEG